MMPIPQPDTREKFRASNQNYDNTVQNRPFKRRGYPNNNSNRYNDYRTRSHTHQTEVNLGIGAVTVTLQDRLQRQDKTHPSQISADNANPVHLILQRSTVLENQIRTKINLTRRSLRPPITVISQT